MLSIRYRHKAIKTGVLLLLVLAGGVFVFNRYVEMPLQLRAQAQHLKVAELSVSVNKLENERAKPLTGKYQRWLNSFNQSKVSDIKLQLLKLFSQSDVKVKQLKFGKIKQGEWSQALPVQLDLRGGFNNLMHLFVKLADSRYVFGVEQIVLERESDALEMRLELQMYVLGNKKPEIGSKE